MSSERFMIRQSLLTITCFLAICHPFCLQAQEEDIYAELSNLPSEPLHTVHFTDVPAIELIRYVSKISNLTFIYDQQDLGFKVSLVGSRPISTSGLVKAMTILLEGRGFFVSKENDCFMIQKGTKPKKEEAWDKKLSSLEEKKEEIIRIEDPLEFFVYKLKYHQGSDIESTLKKIASENALNQSFSVKMLKAIQSLQWVKSTNSLLFSSDLSTRDQLYHLIDSLDVPLRQVFIEVLVIETDARKSSEFGLQWGAGGVIDNRIGFGTGSSQRGGSSFSRGMQQTGPNAPPTGLAQIPLVGGFDMGVIGDIILHKGKSFLTLGALVSALENDHDSTIVLNQKIITQDSKNSTIFVGDNIPFTGSVIQTVGQSQQTTANIEYRDVGVKLSITPMLGEGNVITLDINQEISESLDNYEPTTTSNVNGIRTTKTNMVTHVHVPDQHFLVLSGMIRNSQLRQKSAVPCLGALPLAGVAFNHKKAREEKRNIIIFVRPRIINSFEDYLKITQNHQTLLKEESALIPKAFEAPEEPAPASDAASNH